MILSDLVAQLQAGVGTSYLIDREGADQPTFSPDGKWIAFVAGGNIKKVQVNGGMPITLTHFGSARGIAWAPTGEIFVGSNGGPMSIVPSGGGTPRPFTTVDIAGGDQDHRWPIILPDGRTIVFSIFQGAVPNSHLGVISVNGGPTTSIADVGVFPLGFVNGRLVYVNGSGTLMSIAFNVSKRRVSGNATPHVNEVFVNFASAAAYAALSHNGSLVYEIGAQRGQLVSWSKSAGEHVLLAEREVYSFPRFSPDGQRIAVGITTSATTDVWVFDRRAGTIAKLTMNGRSERAEWSPDGKRVLYRSVSSIMWQPADHSAPEEPLVAIPGMNLLEAVISPVDSVVLLRADGRDYSQDILYVRLGDTVLKTLVRTPASEYGMRFSPNGRWVAYASDVSGTHQVYVTPFPGPGPHYQLSIDGGVEPVWSSDGSRLYYIRGRTVMSASVSLSPEFGVTARESLFTGNYFFPINHANYDVSRAGNEFLFLHVADADVQPMFVYNWKAELPRWTHTAPLEVR